MVAPAGSEMPDRRLMSTKTVNCTVHAPPVPGQSAKDWPVMRS